jgi:DNA-binding CsgD family transcriptional regulator
MGDDPFNALSDLEKEALRLFLVASDQKELARRIGRSPATVEQRLARARRKLGVARSLDAALLLAEREGNQTYGNAIYGESLRGEAEKSALKLWPPKERGAAKSLSFFPTRGRPWNMLPTWARLALILGGMLALLIAAVAVVSLGESITRIVRQVH